jgi:type I restriction enzyme S subunit
MMRDWEIKRLDDLCLIELGKTPYRGDKSFWDAEKKTDNVWLSIADLLNTDGGVVSDSKEYITDKAVKISKIVKKGTLLLSFKLTLGRLAFAGRDLFTNEAIAALTIKNKMVDQHFLFHFLSLFDWNAATEGDVKVKGKTLNKAKLKEIAVHFPKSLNEQRRIAAILDEAFAAIAKAKANAEQNLKNAKELFESYLQGVFENKVEGWEEKTLGDVCSLITDGKHGDCENEVNSGYYFLSAKDVRNNTLLFDNARQINKSGFEETHRRTNLKPGDICMVNTGATIGRISFAPDDSRTYKSTFQKSVAVIKTIPTLINNHYCCYVLQADLKKLVKVSSGTAVPNLLLGDLKRHKINIPKTLKAQQNIVKKLDALSAETKKIEVIYQTKINNLEELKKSILQKAFSGELTKAEVALA